MNKYLRVALSPPAEAGKLDTGLRFTDILFGFVIRELFLRLQNWPQLPGYVRWHLIVGTTLVLGSWIGFRRSTHRTAYEVKFLNLPFFRFLTDQLMIILYFRIAVLTAMDGRNLPPASSLVTNTCWLLVLVFVLYGMWDLINMWMAIAKVRGGPSGTKSPKYPVLREGEMSAVASKADWPGFLISVISLAALAVLRWIVICHSSLNASKADWLFLSAFLILLIYRIAKEVRSSWRSLRPAK